MTTAHRILIVEADPALRRELTELLGTALSVAIEARADAADLAAAAQGCDLVVVDWTLVAGAAAALRDLADAAEAPAIVVLGASDSQVRTLLPAEAGRVVEAIEKPVRIARLAHRLRGRLRRRWDAVGPRLGRYRFDPAARLLVPDPPDEPVRLTAKEAGILDHLLRHGNVAERESLLRALWGFEPDITTHTLETHIYRLRQKIEVDPSRARILVTENGGYRLVTSGPDAADAARDNGRD
jgi:DNA-binding response OmpR family regulator